MPTKKYKVITSGTILAQNNANVVDGITGTTWAGSAPDFATGVTGNPVGNTGLSNVATVQVFEADTAEKIIAIQVTDLSNTDNTIRVPREMLGNYKNKKIIGVEQLGVYNPAATEGATPEASLIKDPSNFAVVKDAIIIRVLQANVTLFDGNFIHLRITIQQ